MLIRSWNLFHGNSSPPGRRAYLEEMARLASADRPDVLLLQEVPAWALPRLAGWSGMRAVVDVARHPRLGPLPIPAEAGRLLTGLNPGLLRSAFAGQGNAILLAVGLHPAEHRVLTLNDRRFRRDQARDLRLDPIARLAWTKERRICQAIRTPREGAAPLVVANLHTTSSPGDARIPAAELLRAAAFAADLSRDGDVVVLGGDFNVGAEDASLDGFSAPGPGIDHIVVRGATPSPLGVWPDERRRRDGILLSDHAPIELEL